jgi:xylulose-5-phosphate/fructose-6-phosphate phosphoketolase
VPGLALRHPSLRQHLQDERLRCREHTRRFGEDAPDIVDWTWPGTTR